MESNEGLHSEFVFRLGLVVFLFNLPCPQRHVSSLGTMSLDLHIAQQEYLFLLPKTNSQANFHLIVLFR